MAATEAAKAPSLYEGVGGKSTAASPAWRAETAVPRSGMRLLAVLLLLTASGAAQASAEALVPSSPRAKSLKVEEATESYTFAFVWPAEGQQFRSKVRTTFPSRSPRR